MGFLPTAASKVEAKLSRGIDEIPSYDEIETEVARLKKLVPYNPKFKKRVIALKEDLKKARLASKVIETEQDLESKGVSENDKSN